MSDVVAGYSLLASGRWHLATCFWHLAAGFLLLAKAQSSELSTQSIFNAQIKTRNSEPLNPITLQFYIDLL
jgi:hypothetical protein